MYQDLSTLELKVLSIGAEVVFPEHGNSFGRLLPFFLPLSAMLPECKMLALPPFRVGARGQIASLRQP